MEEESRVAMQIGREGVSRGRSRACGAFPRTVGAGGRELHLLLCLARAEARSVEQNGP